MDNEINEPAVQYKTRMTADEYLEWERQQEYKNEYHSGEIVAMSGASIAHNHVQSNIYSAVTSHLKGKPCKAFSSDLRVEVKAKESYFYPDITIVCGELHVAGDKEDMIDNPAVIIEILSSSTEQYDTKRKKFFYMQMPSLKEYIMIDSKDLAIDIIRRKNDKWVVEVIVDKEASLTIESIDLQIPLSEIYADVKL